MKKLIFGFLVLSLVVTSSCKKTGPGPGGSWTFKSTTYNTTTCSAGAASLDATNITTSNVSSFAGLSVYFLNALPTTSGTYVVNSYNATANQVSISLGTGGTGGPSYTSTGGNGTQTVSVTVSNGKVSISGTGITMANDVMASDSSAVNFSITQTQ